jgi:perosamine synthetase
VDEAEVTAVTRVLEGGAFASGDECRRFEDDVSAYLRAPHVVAVSSFQTAMDVALASLRLTPGARIAVPMWASGATGRAVLRQGGVPVLLDVDPTTLSASLDSVSRALADGIDALVVVHFGGVAARRTVHELCQVRGVPVIEDASHAFGARNALGMLAGQGSTAACFSFGGGMSPTTGQGGALVTWDPDVAGFARSNIDGCSDADAGDDSRALGIGHALSDVLAALGRSQLATFDVRWMRRRRLAALYREVLGQLAPGITCVPPQYQHEASHQLMPVILPPRADGHAVVRTLADAGIATRLLAPLQGHRWFQHHVGPEVLPAGQVRRPGGSVLQLPLHPAMPETHVDRVCEALARSMS